MGMRVGRDRATKFSRRVRRCHIFFNLRMKSADHRSLAHHRNCPA
jgi:hypothetical protein